MAIEARIRELDSRHETLERAITDENNRPASDDLRLRELKRRKLKLKEELEALRAKRFAEEVTHEQVGLRPACQDATRLG